jgi:DNA polymerase-3 subunit epsilon
MTTGTPEGMAHALEQHPDYRVLRRLKPVLRFSQPTQGACATVLLLDTETTGLDAHREQIIELALLRVQVDISTGLPVGDVQVYDGFEDPGRPIPPAITQLTGITDAQVRGQKLNEAEVARLLTGADVVIAHNAGFDRPFVEARFPAFAEVAWACSWADLDWKNAGQSSAKLEHLTASLGWFYDAHRAETDCHALLTILTQAHPLQAGTHLSALLAAAKQTHHKLYATGAPFESKDVLKARGYRWDVQQRVWQQTLRSDAELEAELVWLADAVYIGQPAKVRVETLDARHRHSARTGTNNVRLIGTGALL